MVKNAWHVLFQAKIWLTYLELENLKSEKMSMSAELMYAILTMDAYNRGYNPGISGLSEVSDGSVQIGTATISFNLDNASLTSQAIAAGFYAVAYQWEGETIISYRGTDSKGELLGTDYPIAVNDDYDEVRVFPSKRVPHAEI